MKAQPSVVTSSFDPAGSSAELGSICLRPLPPIIVMAHGLGGTREVRLDAFAERRRSRLLEGDFNQPGRQENERREKMLINSPVTAIRVAPAFARLTVEKKEFRDGVIEAAIALAGDGYAPRTCRLATALRRKP